MDSIRAVKLVKLFIVVLPIEDGRLDERLEERLILEYGPFDHRLSLVPTEGTIHREFLSFDRLVEIGSLAKAHERSLSIEREFPAKLDLGFLDNRRAAMLTNEGSEGEDAIQFKDGGIHFFPRTDPAFLSGESQDFFLTMRNIYRNQLRTVCLLRR